MTVDSWQPAPPPAATISPDQLTSVYALASEPFDLTRITEQLSWLEPLARSDKASWATAAATLNGDELKHCIRFFTTLEEACNLDLGSKSPVIPLFKALKKQIGIDRSLVQWVKSNTKNQYLPFGPLA